MTGAPCRATARISGKDSGGRRAAIIGGSVSGLSAGLALREVGYDVEIFERSPNERQGRGAGIRPVGAPAFPGGVRDLVEGRGGLPRAEGAVSEPPTGPRY